MVSKDHCPQVLKHCEALFEKLIWPQLSNSFFGDLASFVLDADEEGVLQGTSKSLPPLIHCQLQTILGHVQPTSAQFVSWIELDGIMYMVPSTHLGNSFILVKQHNSILCPGCIQSIFCHSGQNFITIRFYQSLHGNNSVDPFASHSVLQCYIWSNHQMEQWDLCICYLIELHCSHLMYTSCNEIFVVSLHTPPPGKPTLPPPTISAHMVAPVCSVTAQWPHMWAAGGHRVGIEWAMHLICTQNLAFKSPIWT